VEELLLAVAAAAAANLPEVIRAFNQSLVESRSIQRGRN
jgi:hypothetical protein